MQDLLLRGRGAAVVSPQLIVIGRDADSDARFGGGIWDRARIARVVEGLGRAHAAVIALDFHFAGESPPERGGGASDAALMAATMAAGTVVYPVPLTLQRIGETAGTPQIDPSLGAALARAVPSFDPAVLRALPQVGTLSAPLATLMQPARALGHIAAISDPDGVYRRVPLLVNAGGQPVPALGLAVAAAYLHVLPGQISLRLGESLVLNDAHFPDGSRHALTLPVDGQGNLLINYAGRWTEGRFPYLSFVDVWDALEEGREAELQQQINGAIVLLVHAALGSDKRRTPLELAAPGGFIHANVINTIITGQTLTMLSPAAGMILALSLAVLVAVLLGARPGWRGLGVSVGLAAVYTALAQMVLTFGGWLWPMLIPELTMALAGALALVWSSREAARQASRLETTILTVRGELAAARELYARRETIVERLAEELEQARAVSAASINERQRLGQQTTALNQKLEAAEAQSAATKQELQRLEAQLTALSGALVKPVRLSTMDLEALRQESERLGLLTQDPTMLGAFRDLKKAARSQATVLILGETGTGKELCAKAVHALSPRASGPYVAVNVGAISPDLVESELFGHVKGAFTGASTERKGYFGQAQHGTIFLDEIGDLQREAQVKLLRVLQEGTFYCVGATSPTRVDVRVVAATNKDLAQGVAEGWFREDLYFRLKGIELRLPPLRLRPDDIPLLADRFVRVAARQVERPTLGLSQGALDALARWRWPGNVRELRQRVEQAVVLAEGDLITEQDLRLEPGISRMQAEPGRLPQSAVTAQPLDISGDDAVLACLRQHRFDMQATAQALGWDRSTVTQRLKGMCYRALVEHGGDRTQSAATLAGTPALVRVVELKLHDYADHLLNVAAEFGSVGDAVAGCRRRFKNLPERYLPMVEALIRQQYR